MANFDSNGLWVYNGSTWTKLSSLNVENIEAWGDNYLSADFGSNGTWTYYGSYWARLSTLNPDNPNGMEGWN